MERLLYALTHVASQLLYRWLPPPVISSLDLQWLSAACGGKNNYEPHALTELQWREILHWCLAEGCGILPWFKVYSTAYSDIDGSTLCRVAQEHFARLDASKGRYLSLSDPDYPQLLKQIPDPPLGLSALGDIRLLQRPTISVIGSRQASCLALQESVALGEALARRQVAVVSGGAFGCDIAAHIGVLRAVEGRPAPAIIVFAGGLSALYPRAHSRIFDRLRAQHALLLSERLFDASCRPVDFPARNRIIAGLSGVTAVMQAAKRSGALITARLALDQGREVCALQHPPGDVRASGSAELLQAGAHGFVGAEDLLGRLESFEAFLPDF